MISLDLTKSSKVRISGDQPKCLASGTGERKQEEEEFIHFLSLIRREKVLQIFANTSSEKLNFQTKVE